MIKVIAAILVLVGTCPGLAAWQNVAGEWEQYRLNDSQMKWFKSVRSKQGVPCCNQADGHPR